MDESSTPPRPVDTAAEPEPSTAQRKRPMTERLLLKQSEQIKALTGLVRKQAVQIKQLREELISQDSRWQQALERVTEVQARVNKDERAEQKRQEQAWREQWDMVNTGLKREAKWRTTFTHQLDAVVRHLFFPHDLEQPFALKAQRFQIRSQFEEDGIILALLRAAGIVTRRFVEIGSGQTGGNSAFLALDFGWQGLMLDMSATALGNLRRRMAINPGVQAVEAYVTSANVNDVLTANGYAGEVDLLSLDIDSYDYWVLSAITVCQPRVLVVEYNAAFGDRAVTIPDGHSLDGSPKGYHGASLRAMTQAAKAKGYRLVLCDESGVNAFFVRHDLAPGIPELPVERAFKPALSRVDIGEELPSREVFALAADQDLPLVELPDTLR